MISVNVPESLSPCHTRFFTDLSFSKRHGEPDAS